MKIKIQTKAFRPASSPNRPAKATPGPCSKLTTIRIWLLALLLFCLILILSACVEQVPKVIEPPKPPQSYCVWLLWSNNLELLEKAQGLLAEGESFSGVSRILVKEGGSQVRSNLDCMPAARMEPALLAVVKELKLGQVSKPMALNQGHALIMRTTDQYRREGYILYEQGLYAKAEKALEKDLELHPHSPDVWHLLAMCRSSLGKLDQSLAAMDRALELEPESASVLQDKATALVSLGKEDQALDLYEKSLAKDPDNALVMSNLAWTLAKLKRQLPRAESLAKRSLEKDSQNPRYWNTLGTVYSAQGRHSHALVCYYRTSALDPSFPNVNERILNSLKELSPYEVTKLANIPQDMVQITTIVDPDADEPAKKAKSNKKTGSEKSGSKKSVASNKLAFSLQVGAYRKAQVAKDMIKLWNRRGQKAFLEVYKSKKTGVWFRLMVGDYGSKSQAREMAAQFVNKGYMDDYVIQVRKMSYVREKIIESGGR